MKIILLSLIEYAFYFWMILSAAYGVYKYFYLSHHDLFWVGYGAGVLGNMAGLNFWERVKWQ